MEGDLWFWLSASDIGRQPGQFRWSDGTPLDKNMWHEGIIEALGASKQACVALVVEVAALSDYDCTQLSNVMCEVSPGILSCYE
jgi:hypothetical protein